MRFRRYSMDLRITKGDWWWVWGSGGRGGGGRGGTGGGGEFSVLTDRNASASTDQRPPGRGSLAASEQSAFLHETRTRLHFFSGRPALRLEDGNTCRGEASLTSDQLPSQTSASKHQPQETQSLAITQSRAGVPPPPGRGCEPLRRILLPHATKHKTQRTNADVIM
ncbi:hypothetical protein NHX12_023251 [Muraenolepis orangiensis]|uniref:Uncharacterized protein n=1 Tax=Muraenolepis orangiensis TaxID=630683 RepID=A0A9Q0EKR7_9TELE|nr:hypothetical protein NHX12_023251 [Muraenolepis orangiensis]